MKPAPIQPLRALRGLRAAMADQMRRHRLGGRDYMRAAEMRDRLDRAIADALGAGPQLEVQS